MEQLFKCASCGKMTPLVQKKESIVDDIKHHYFECMYCKSKATIYYSYTKLRKLIKQQQHTKDRVKQKSLEKIIKNKMNVLKEKFGES